MLRLRTEQVARFDELARADYEARLRAWLVAEWPECFDAMASADVDAWVRLALAIAERHGFELELDTTQLVAILLLVGVDAPKSMPWVGAILRDETLAPRGKTRRLLQRARQEGIDGVDEVAMSTGGEEP